MAKVELNENVNKKQLIRESVESCVRAIRSKYPDDGDAMISAFFKMHMNDIAGMTPEECVAEYEEYRTADLDSLDETESSINESRGDLTDLTRIIDDRIRHSDFGREVEIEEVIENLADHYGYDVVLTKKPDEELDEKKGKDHDGDGDVDSKDYLAGRDKAIKKAMGKDVNEAEEKIKRALKKKIVQILNEGSLNEAATNQLADLADQYAGFDGMKGAILDLQNIVTDIESYYDKTRGKIQRVYDTLGEIRNEEGLKVGAFIAPAVESAFNKDLRPVVKDGFTKGLDTPKVKTLSQADIDAAGGGDLEEKQTVFNENKKTK